MTHFGYWTKGKAKLRRSGRETQTSGAGSGGEAYPHKRRLKCDTKHQSQEADATFITSDGSKPYKPWGTLDTDNNNK